MHTTDSRQFSHLESQNFSLSVSLSRFFPLSPSLFRCLSSLFLASFGVSRTPDTYAYSRAFRFVLVPLVHTRISLSLFLLTFSLALFPSCSLLFVLREHVREVRFPLASLSLPPSQPALVLLVLFAPFRFTTGAGRLCPPSPLPPLATLYIAKFPLSPYSLACPGSRRGFVGFPLRSLAVHPPTVSSSVRCTSLSISPAGGGKGVRFYKWFQPRTGAGVVFRVIGRRLCHAVVER